MTVTGSVSSVTIGRTKALTTPSTSPAARMVFQPVTWTPGTMCAATQKPIAATSARRMNLTMESSSFTLT